MKPFLTFLSIALGLSVYGQQWKLTSNYSLALPGEEMNKNIQPAHSLQLGALYSLPGRMKQLSLGVEFGIGTYASKRIDQTFQFDNSTSIVPVNYSSNVFNTDLQARFNLLNEKKLVIPYINAKGGLYNFFSTIRVDDPRDDGGCHALERKNIINDKTLYWSAGAGIQFDPSIFSSYKHHGQVLIDISANTVRGGTLDYINTKHLVDAQSVNDNSGKPLQVRFVNASTQSIHEHTVAQVYTSPLRLFEIRAGVVVKL